MKFSNTIMALTIALTASAQPIELLFDCNVSTTWGGCCASFNSEGDGVDCVNATLTDGTPEYVCSLATPGISACCHLSTFIVFGAHQLLCDQSEVIYT